MTDLRSAARRVIEVVDEPSPQDDGTPEVEALWYLEWQERHLAAVEDLRTALAADEYGGRAMTTRRTGDCVDSCASRTDPA